MAVRRKASTNLSIAVGALVGNFLGAQIHFLATGRRSSGVFYQYTSEGGVRSVTAPVWTIYMPALLFSRLGKPRWAFSFLGGLLAGSLAGDRLQERLTIWLVQRIQARMEKEKPASAHTTDQA